LFQPLTVEEPGDAREQPVPKQQWKYAARPDIRRLLYNIDPALAATSINPK
jgi:hypothetical protein